MTFVRSGYLTRALNHGLGKVPNYIDCRNWWLIKNGGGSGQSGVLNLGNVSFPKEMIGKRVRFKIEIIEDEVPK